MFYYRLLHMLPSVNTSVSTVANEKVPDGDRDFRTILGRDVVE